MVMIEHQLDMIKNADYVIDLGPKQAKRGATSSVRAHPKRLQIAKIPGRDDTLSLILRYEYQNFDP